MNRYGFLLALGTTAIASWSCAEEQEQAGALIEMPVTEDVAATLPGGAGANLDEVNGSGIHGTVRLSRAESGLNVDLALDEVRAETKYLAHIHRGECGNDQGVAAPLGHLIVTEAGATASEKVEPSAIDPRQPHFVQVHAADMTPVACGNLDLAGLDLTGSPAGAKTAQEGSTY